MSISKFQAALANATQEMTFALANCNVDFAVIKVAAPAEFQGLGSALSRRRKTAAEDGQPHIIARRLGSLFSSMLPNIPNLVKAYGIRASDTSKSVSTERTSKLGFFQDFAGVDGTSIWAAATSGTEAIAIHLLACMLARFWPTPEALSIWEELVSERKKRLLKLDSEFISLEDAVASQLEITKEQLAQWHASAKAWLRAADSAPENMKRQKRVIELLAKMPKPVNGLSDVYESVTQAWITALSTMDQIIGGISYSVSNGSVLLALSAWHIYPDILVLGDDRSEIKNIKQNDKLVGPGGAVVIGWNDGRDTSSSHGVTWCLSLAYLQYYGFPVVAERKINEETGRFSCEELMNVALGAVIGSWGIHAREIKAAVKLIVEIGNSIQRYLETSVHPIDRVLKKSWIFSLFDLAKGLEKDRRPAWKEVHLGFRRYKFLTGRRTKVFLLRQPNIISLVHDQFNAVQLLRKMASGMNCEKRVLIKVIWESRVEFFTTLWPYASSTDPSVVVHHAWIKAPNEDDMNAMLRFDSSMEIHVVDNESYTTNPNGTIRWIESPFSYGSSSKSKIVEKSAAEPKKRSLFRNGKAKSEESPAASQEHATPRSPQTFLIIAGSPSDVGLYELSDNPTFLSNLRSTNNQLELSDIHELISKGDIKAWKLLMHLNSLAGFEETAVMVASLRALMAINMIYENLPGATISPQIIASTETLGRSLWVMHPGRYKDEAWKNLLPFILKRRDVFACIAMLESGSFNIDPNDLARVMAISIEDSMYIAAPLLNDPAANIAAYEVRRIAGNIGRAGMAFLIPPNDSNIRPYNPDNWRSVDHEEYDGTLNDSYQQTSLHLSFTGYESPIALGQHGGRFSEAYFIEAVVSLYDKGQWFADLDILKAMEASSLTTIVQQPHCKTKPAGHKPEFYVSSIDKWEEILDLPDNSVVVRAHGNWQARLAAAAISMKLGHITILFQGHGCWDCGKKTLDKVVLQSDGYEQNGANQNHEQQAVFIL